MPSVYLVTGGRLDRSQAGRGESFSRAPDPGAVGNLEADPRSADLSGPGNMPRHGDPGRIGGASLGPLFMSAATGFGAAGYCLWAGYGIAAALGAYVAAGVVVFLVSALAIFAVVSARGGKCD